MRKLALSTKILTLTLMGAGCGSDVGEACSSDTDCADYCIACPQAPEMGPVLTCGAFGDPDRYAETDLGPLFADCNAANPCPPPYECVPSYAGDDDPSCMLPCSGRDCPDGYGCDSVDVEVGDEGVPCGYCTADHGPPPGSGD